MNTYMITIEERKSEVFPIEATNIEEALRIASEQYRNKEFVICPDVMTVAISGKAHTGEKWCKEIDYV